MTLLSGCVGREGKSYEMLCNTWDTESVPERRAFQTVGQALPMANGEEPSAIYEMDDAEREEETEIAKNFDELPGDGVVDGVRRNKDLLCAAQEGRLEDVVCLLNEGADVSYKRSNGYTALSLAAVYYHWEVVKVLISAGSPFEDSSPESPLHLAVSSGQLDVVSALLAGGAPVDVLDYDADTPLHYAARKGDVKCIEILVAAGANLETWGLGNADTPLHQSVRRGHVQCVQSLLKAGANVNVENDLCETPLHGAEDPKVITVLVQARANLNHRNFNGDTPLHTMAERGSSVAVHGLLNAGAKPTIRNSQGKQPIDMAKGHVVKALLLDATK